MAKKNVVVLTYIKIKSMQPTLKEELQSIAKYNGTDLSSFLKPKLREIANSYPIEIRRFNQE